MHKHRKGIAPIIIILIIIVLAGIGSSVYYFNSKQEVKKINQTGETKIEDLIPGGWKIIGQAEGDLNGDKLSDKAMVIEKEVDPLAETAPARSLLIAFKDSNGSYNLFTRSDRAVLRADQGGVFGDPFDQLSIRDGVLTVSFYGGSNWRWSATYDFKYQNGDFYLIKKSDYNYYSGDDCTYQKNEYNFLTAKRKEATSSRWDNYDSTLKIIPCSEEEKLIDIDNKELVNLQDFDINSDF